MKVGLFWCNRAPYIDPPGIGALVTSAEAAGFESLWTSEHVVLPETYDTTYPYSENGRLPVDATYPYPDPIVWTTYAVAVSTRINFCSGAIVLPQRNPVVLAKELATLDVLSRGRVSLGAGVGWFREEFEAVGVPFAARGKRTDEYIDAMRSLWSCDETFDGEFTSFANARCYPKPTSELGVPIVVCGHSEAAARRAGTRGNGFFPLSDKWLELVELCRTTAKACGRDPDEIEITLGHEGVPDLDALRAYDEAGVSRIVMHPPVFDVAAIAGALDELSTSLIKPAASLRRRSKSA